MRAWRLIARNRVRDAELGRFTQPLPAIATVGDNHVILEKQPMSAPIVAQRNKKLS